MTPKIFVLRQFDKTKKWKLIWSISFVTQVKEEQVKFNFQKADRKPRSHPNPLKLNFVQEEGE